MKELSQSELLLLDNFMYICESTEEDSSVGEIVQRLLVNGITKDSLSGGISVEDAEEILKEIRSNPTLCNLKVKQSINTKKVRASCFVDEDGNATVAFRGTGGSYEAWKDNLLGAYQVDTECQKIAAKFIRKDCAEYENITITGHSKGGNMAQYCTITCGDKIDRCISYDGQGVNLDFYRKYSDKIITNRDKISCINCDGDYVNGLLFLLSKDVRYLQTEKDANPHSSWELYHYNKDKVNQIGDFTAWVEQTEEMKMLDKICDILVLKIGSLPSDQEEAIIDALASWVGLAFAASSNQLTEQNWIDFMDTIGQSISVFTGDIGQSSIRPADFYISCDGLMRNAGELIEIERSMNSLYKRLVAVQIPKYIFENNKEMKQTLELIHRDVKNEKESIKDCADTLAMCVKYYQKAEQKIIARGLSVNRQS